GIYGREMYETWNTMSAMLSTSQTLRTAITRTITDVLPAAQWERGFEIAKAGTAGKVVLDWSTPDACPAPPDPAPPRLHPTCPDLTRTHLACPCPAPSAPTSCRGRGLSSYTAFRSRQRQEVRSRPKDFTMYTDLKDQLTAELTEIEEAGTFKHERVITTPQAGRELGTP